MASDLCKEVDNEIQCHVHPRYIWLLMVRPVLLLLLILFALNVAYIYPEVQSAVPWPFTFSILEFDILLTIFILVPSYIWIWMQYRSFVYIIKNEELFIRKGVIRKRNNAIPYNKIRNVERLQSILERLFGLCTISIESSGISTYFPNFAIPGMLNSRELPDIILDKTHADQDEETDIGDTMRKILLQLKDLNKK